MLYKYIKIVKSVNILVFILIIRRNAEDFRKRGAEQHTRHPHKKKHDWTAKHTTLLGVTPTKHKAAHE